MASPTNANTLSTKLHRNVLNMPKWVHETNDRVGPKPPAPPSNAPDIIAKAPALPPKMKTQPEPDYEVIEFSGQQYSNEMMKSNAASRSNSKTPDSKLKCTLCGSSNPWVTCGECAQQIFCASCDDMFHKHPKRKTHVRKAIEQALPPLPPKTLPGQPGTLTPPVAPPRRSKRGMTPLLPRKDQVNIANGVPIPPSPTPSMKNASWHDRVSSLKRGLNLMNRPLPDTPQTPTTPSDGASSRSTTPKSVFDNIQRPPSVTLEKIKSKASATLDRMALLQQRYRQHKEQSQKEQISRNNSITDQNHPSFDQWSSISQTPSHFRSGSMSSGINSSHFDLTEDSHFNLSRQRQLPPAQRNGQLGNRGMSTSVFNLNQINRRVPEPQNAWMNNTMQQAQSMAQLNCMSCTQGHPGWPGHQHPQPDWGLSQQQLNRSNMSLNVAPGYMMPHHHGAGMMAPPPVFMNQNGVMGHMYPYPYGNGMPVMNPGIMGMPPSARSRATSRAGSRATSPAMSRKSMQVRRKRTTSNYVEDELTDDEDSDQDDRRSIISNRSGALGNVPRPRQRRLSSASQLLADDENEANNSRRKIRDRRGSVAKSVQSDWLPGKRTATTPSTAKPQRIYSDLDSESSGTRALVQAKIQEKLNENSKQKAHSAKGRTSDSDTAHHKPQKVSTEVQAGSVRSKNQKTEEPQEPVKAPPPKDSESEEEQSEAEEEESAEEEEQEEQACKEEVTNTEADTEKAAENEEDESDLGPPPSTPDYEWECEFCTYVNEPNVKICLICCKTPSAMPRKLNATKIPPKEEPPKPKTVKAVPAQPPKEVKEVKKKTTTTTTTATTMNSTKPKSSVVAVSKSTTASTGSLTNGKSKLRTTSSGTDSDYSSVKKKQESLDDIWAALDDNIQATANEVIRKAETKKVQKVSTSCGTSPIREVQVVATKTPEVKTKMPEKRVKETGTSPPPQSISTQTYDVLPIHHTEPSVPEASMVRAISNTTLFNENRQIPRDMHSPLSSFSPDLPHFEPRHTGHRDPETELYILLKEAELYKFTPEELHAAMKYCGPSMNPVQWLRENWHKLIQTVQSLATKYGQERSENIIGTISQVEARDALRLHSGNIWQAVSECIEQRQRKFRDLFSKGNFSREDVVTALTVHQGNMELALIDLGRTQLKPFLMRIQGSPAGMENESGALPFSPIPLPTGTENINSEIHEFLSANASECLQTPNAAGAFLRSHSSTLLHDSTNDQHLSEANYSYSPDGREFTDSTWQLDDPMLGNRNMLKDLETLIGNMEQNQAKQNEQVLRSIESMLGNALAKKDNSESDIIDPEATRMLMKSPIITAKTKAVSQPQENNRNQLDVKNFVWQHIQEIVPNLVQQVEMELMEQDANEDTMEMVVSGNRMAPPEPPPIDAEEFIREEVIAPNIKEATIREELPPEFVYASEIANFRMEFDKARDLMQEENDELYTLDEVESRVYKMYVGPEEEKAEEVNENVVALDSIEQSNATNENETEEARAEVKIEENAATDTNEDRVVESHEEPKEEENIIPTILSELEQTTQSDDTISSVVIEPKTEETTVHTTTSATEIITPAEQQVTIEIQHDTSALPDTSEAGQIVGKQENKDTIKDKPNKHQKRQQKRSNLPKTINNTIPKQNAERVQSKEAVNSNIETTSTSQQDPNSVPQEIKNFHVNTDNAESSQRSTKSKERQAKTSRIPVRRALSSKLPRPIPNVVGGLKSSATPLDNENVATLENTNASTEHIEQMVETNANEPTLNSTETMQTSEVHEVESFSVPAEENISNLENHLEIETQVNAPTTQVTSNNNQDILEPLESNNTELNTDPEHITEPIDEVPQPSPTTDEEKKDEFQDAVEHSTDDEENDHSTIHDEDSEGELYSLDSETSNVKADAEFTSPEEATNEVLLMLDPEQQVANIQSSSSNTTVNSITSQALKPKDFVPSGDPTKQNLSELVKDTQRLIQQMKDEITIDDFESSEEDYTGDYTDEEFDEGEEEEWEESLSGEYEEGSLSGEEDIDDDESYFDEDEEEGLGEEEEGIDEHEMLIAEEHNDAEAHNESTAEHEDMQEDTNNPSFIAIETLTTTNESTQIFDQNHFIESISQSQNNSITLVVPTPVNPSSLILSDPHEAQSVQVSHSSYINENQVVDQTSADLLPGSEAKLPELPVETVLISSDHDQRHENQSMENESSREQPAIAIISNTEPKLPELPVETVLSNPAVEEINDPMIEVTTANDEITMEPAITMQSSGIENPDEDSVPIETAPQMPTITAGSSTTSVVTEDATASTSKNTTSTNIAAAIAKTANSINDSKTITKTTKVSLIALKGTPAKSTATATKPKESKIPKHSSSKKAPARSKSFSGPPGPIGISSVKTIQQEFLNRQKQLKSAPAPAKLNPPPVLRKNSITEAITKLTTTQPSTSSGLSSGASTSVKAGLFRTHTRIPKKKYHETCFSDDDYDTTTTEEEPEPVELRDRKMSVPVFRTYPSIQEPEVEQPEILARKYVEEKLVSNVAEAHIAAALVNMKFPQDVSLWAAKECSDLDQAIALLQQDCELCMGTYPLNQIVSMLKCTHKCCKQCAKTYFTVQITDRSINDCSCPFCKLPTLDSHSSHEDENLEYFSNLDIFLKNILDAEVHELFQRKLRDRTLLQDPNFKWCIQCSSGFFARPKQKRLICPDCGSVTCSQCRKTWEKQHEGISCEKFLEWKMANDPEVQAQGVQEHLAQNGIDCPKCKFRYSLARGGCMHFTCTQCKFEFCYGCGKPFMMGAKCSISSYCAKLGLHAHHPRNCLFYLRDKLPIQLQMLLKENGVPFDEDPQESTEAGAHLRCPIQLQKETPKGLVDAVCNNEVPAKHAGLCRTHYVEYLTAKVAQARIDPLPIFDLTDCVQELRRRDIPLPERGPWDTDEIYKNMCSEIIRKNIPLEMK